MNERKPKSLVTTRPQGLRTDEVVPELKLAVLDLRMTPRLVPSTCPQQTDPDGQLGRLRFALEGARGEEGGGPVLTKPRDARTR